MAPVCSLRLEESRVDADRGRYLVREVGVATGGGSRICEGADGPTASLVYDALLPGRTDLVGYIVCLAMPAWTPTCTPWPLSPPQPVPVVHS